MPREVIELLAPRPGQVIIDCTVGAGGHSLAILPYLMSAGVGLRHQAGEGAGGRLLGIDCDAQALQRAQSRLVEFRPSIQLIQENFRYLPEVLASVGVPKVHGLIADLGFSSLQVDQAERGFSFSKEGPLDMRMDQRRPTTAATLIQRLSERELAELLQSYGEERWARRIAKRIVAARKVEPIQTTTRLARLVADAVPRTGSWRRLHPATRTFQALRIAVNEELVCLGALLDALPAVLMPGGRAVIITFHSLEDRPVKHAFQQGARGGLFRLLTKKPLCPSDEETSQNPRSRSAKLRAVERL
ncbi:MAG: 16S rRNA (cytosine(1402)-N(4))-methyltransferase RsmH [Candidatus Omnitrophica bacterium]|nr:16S rRNA (cytosine(1402)-N(4))-methyltransferase RsmH [Candidatus Omnitrophota bacterium]